MNNNFSIIIPCFNESKNLKFLINNIIDNVSQIYNYEIIIIDDGSNDDTENVLNNLKNFKSIIYLKNEKNLGQSKSILKGIKSSNYKTIVTLDGDGQNPPSDINKLVSIYFTNDEVKLVAGIRKNRNDSLLKIYSSIISNYVRNMPSGNILTNYLGVKIHQRLIT